MNPALHSSARHDWQTPDVVLDLVRRVGPIAMDPCTVEENPCNAAYIICPPDDGLAMRWTHEMANGLTFVNCPYGRDLRRWVLKCRDEAHLGDEVVALVPCRPDTFWYDVAKQSANALCEVRGRLRFKGADAGAPFPSAIFYWGPSCFLFCHVFQTLGRVEVLRQRAA